MVDVDTSQNATPNNRDKTGRFQKKHSGNPNGRPKLPKEFKELAKVKSVDALKKLIKIMESPDSKYEQVIRACELIIAYGVGKPQQSMDISAKVDNPFAGLTTEELKKLVGDE